MHTPSCSWLLVFCFSVGGVKRSSSALPPVGGALQSQVAVGGTEALLRRRKRPGSSPHLCVLKQVGNSRLGSDRSVFCCTDDSRRVSTVWCVTISCNVVSEVTIWYKDEKKCSHC